MKLAARDVSGSGEATAVARSLSAATMDAAVWSVRKSGLLAMLKSRPLSARVSSSSIVSTGVATAARTAAATACDIDCDGSTTAAAPSIVRTRDCRMSVRVASSTSHCAGEPAASWFSSVAAPAARASAPSVLPRASARGAAFTADTANSVVASGDAPSSGSATGTSACTTRACAPNWFFTSLHERRSGTVGGARRRLSWCRSRWLQERSMRRGKGGPGGAAHSCTVTAPPAAASPAGSIAVMVATGW